MITVSTLQMLKKLPSSPREGEYAIVERPKKQMYIYKNNNWEKCDNQNSLNMNLYDINSTAISQLPSHNFDLMEIGKDVQIINDYTEKTNDSYYSLICKSLRNGAFYLTVFRKNPLMSKSLGAEAMSLLMEIGEVKLISEEEDHVEIWITENGYQDSTCFLLFPSSNMVMEVS